MRTVALWALLIGSGSLGMLSAQTAADACGIRSLGADAAVSYSSARTPASKGSIVIYGDTQVKRRLLMGLKSAGHSVHYTMDPDELRGADVILTSMGAMAQAQRDLRGSEAVLVVVAAGDEDAGGAEYVVRPADRYVHQVAVVEQALEVSKDRG